MNVAESDGELIVNGSELRLGRAIYNLIENGIKYASKSQNPKVEIRTSKIKNKIRINILDNGLGISESEQQKIFERFYRVDKSRSQNGFGLGLAITKNIVAEHGGTISVKSTASKTTFTVTLPLI